MNSKKVIINILGCCVLRDTFGMHENDGGYQIGKYVQIPNPVSVVTASPLVHPDEEVPDEIFKGKSPFITRCQMLELKKQIFEFLGGGKADYLIIDSAEFRKMLYYFPENNGWFTESHRDVFCRLIENNLIPSEYEVVDPLNIDKNKLHLYMEKYCQNILSMYQPSQIILFEIEAVELYTNGKELLVFAGEHEKADKFNARMRVCFGYLKTLLQGCHIIEFPKGTMGDSNHKWGRGMLHYTSEYYDYSRRAVDIITKNRSSREDEKAALRFLKRNYEYYMHEKYAPMLRTTLEGIRKKQSTSERILKYEVFFKHILLNNSKSKMREFLVNHTIEECSLYGKTPITDIFISWFREWNININFIVENYDKNQQYEGIMLVKRDDSTLINTKCMIICDANDVAVKAKLNKLMFAGSIFSYNDLIM